MKKRFMLMLAAGLFLFPMTACGDDGVKTITKETTVENEAAAADDETKEALTGYLFDTGNGEIAVDMPMEDALKALGEEKDYFEAASCAFEDQLDKTYTYDHYEVKTYPNEDGSKDFVSYINLFDDTVSTAEGLYIGEPAEKAVELYGEGYTESGTAYIYEKDGMKLQLLTEDGNISGITYMSSILDQ